MDVVGSPYSSSGQAVLAGRVVGGIKRSSRRFNRQARCHVAMIGRVGDGGYGTSLKGLAASESMWE